MSAVSVETATGGVPMLAYGIVERTGDALAIRNNAADAGVAWRSLPRASRILAVRLAVPAASVPHIKVWLWKGPTPTKTVDWIDVTGAITPTPEGGARIAFRDLSGDETFRRWLRGTDHDPPFKLILHRHDDGFGIDISSDQATKSTFAIGCGVPGSTIYAIRVGRP